MNENKQAVACIPTRMRGFATHPTCESHRASK